MLLAELLDAARARTIRFFDIPLRVTGKSPLVSAAERSQFAQREH